MKLLSKSNIKLLKSKALGYITYGLSLSLAKTSGYQVCPYATTGCKAACIFNSGLAIIHKHINEARIRKTIEWMTKRDEFKANLLKDLSCAIKSDLKVAVRLNVFSDIPWESQFAEVFTKYPQIQFYDYTKNPNRMKKFLSGDFPSNYHLTFSRSEKNEDEAISFLKSGGNVAIPFSGELSTKWKKYTVINGDEHDLRFLDKNPRIVGLKAKGKISNRNVGHKVGFIL